MGLEENKAITRRWLDECWCKGNVDAADELTQWIQTWRKAFPDGRMQLLDELAEGELVGVRLLWTGTHLGGFLGVPPSGRTVTCVFLGVHRVQDGKLAEGWYEQDLLGLMQRLGGLPGTIPGVQPAQALEAPTWPWPSHSPAARNKAVVRRFLRALDAWELDAAREECDGGIYVEHTTDWGTLFLDEALRARAVLRSSLPDLSFTPDEERMVGEGDRVLIRGTFSGTHTGTPLWGAPASGKKLVWGGIDIFRVTEGRLTERWRCSDTLSLRRQAGAASGR